MRTRAKLDALHPEVVAALEEVGCACCSLAQLGSGVPDLLVYSPWRRPPGLLLIEVKTGVRGRFTPAEAHWIDHWPGHVYVVRSAEEALEAAGLAVSTARAVGARFEAPA